MAECAECGARNSASSTFCVRCGAQFDVGQAAPAAADTVRPDASRLLDEAAEMYATGRLDAAVRICRAALDADPDSASNRSLLAMIEEERGNLAAALAEYEAVIRLAPERTAERGRADRLRALVSAQTASALPQDLDTSHQRRWLPLIVGASVVVVVLALGAMYMAGRDRAAQEATREASQDASPVASGLHPNPGMAGTPAARPLSFGKPIVPGRPIGTPLSEPLAPQRRARTGNYRSPAGPPTTRTLIGPSIPPPTVMSRDGQGPLTVHSSGPLPATPPVPATTTASRATPPATPRPPAGKVRIWMGQREAAAATREAPPASTGGADRGQRRSGELLASATGSSSTSMALTGRRRSGRSGDAASPTPTRARAASSRPTRSASPRSGTTASRAESVRRQALTATGAFRGASPITGSPSRSGPPATSSPRPYSGTRSRSPSPSPRTASGSSPPGAAAARTTPSSAADLRTRAQKAWGEGRTDDAKQMYRSAIRQYEAEATGNPGRAAVSRSGIESSQRALDALDAQ